MTSVPKTQNTSYTKRPARSSAPMEKVFTDKRAMPLRLKLNAKMLLAIQF
jgi:hypothetical protein